MGTAVFDTLEAQQGLIDAGIEDKHATAMVDMTRKSISGNVATKEDISHLETRLMGGLVKTSNRTIAGIGIIAVLFLGGLAYLMMGP